MFIKYINPEGKLTSIYTTEGIEYITSNDLKKEIYIKYKNLSDSNEINVRILSLNNKEEIQKVLLQFAKLLNASLVTAQITETENLDTIL